ncbi:MAG TPA: SdrD B-like domain-containing protein, partial [Anaerolineales bacterium]
MLGILLCTVFLAGCAGAGTFAMGLTGDYSLSGFTQHVEGEIAQPAYLQTPTPDPDQPEVLGPDDFPAGYNPLTGQPLCDPQAADWGVVGISISQFPPQATRPATGLSWAAWVTEWWIGDGDTRLYVLYYGCYPEVDVDNVLGDQQGGNQTEPGEDEYLISDLVWYDSNSNAMQDPGEPGVPGVQAELILNGAVLATTTSDGAGKYAFIIEPEFGVSYQVRFTLPASLEQAFHFVGKN